MKPVSFQPGDRVLVKRIHGFKWISELICWWTNSKFSHVEPVLNDQGLSVDATIPRLKMSNANDYFNGQYRVLVLRPKGWTDEQRAAFTNAIGNNVGMVYDLKCFWGFLTNKPVWSGKELDCAELTLLGDHAAGVLAERDRLFITPQSYYEYACAGMFDIIGGTD